MQNKTELSNETIIIRNRMLNSMTTPKTVRMMANSLKLKINTINYHLVILMNEGYLAQTTVESNGRKQYAYQSKQLTYMLENYIKAKEEIENKDRNPHARKVLLADNRHWDMPARKSGKVYIGSTLSDAYLSI